MFDKVTILVDVSYSIEDYLELYTETVNNILEILPRGCLVTLYKFSYIPVMIFAEKKVETIPVFSQDYFLPELASGIYDSVLRVLEKQENNGKQLVIIMTDGDDNSSCSESLPKLKGKIAGLKNCGWKFIYTTTSDISTVKGLDCNHFIKYDTTPESFEKVWQTVEKLVTPANVVDQDFDVSELTLMMEVVEIVD